LEAAVDWNAVTAVGTVAGVVLVFLSGAFGAGLVKRYRTNRDERETAREFLFGRPAKGTDKGSEGWITVGPRLVDDVATIKADVKTLLRNGNGHG
jgi:hypothetical protein